MEVLDAAGIVADINNVLESSDNASKSIKHAAKSVKNMNKQVARLEKLIDQVNDFRSDQLTKWEQLNDLEIELRRIHREHVESCGSPSRSSSMSLADLLAPGEVAELVTYAGTVVQPGSAAGSERPVQVLQLQSTELASIEIGLLNDPKAIAVSDILDRGALFDQHEPGAATTEALPSEALAFNVVVDDLVPMHATET